MSLLFWGTLLAILLLDLSLLATLAVSNVRVWPPPGRRSGEYGFTWTLFVAAATGVIVVGGLDRGSLGLARWVGASGPLILGSMLVVSGTAIASYPMGYIGRRAALGLTDELVTDGPYSVSRTPAYVGDLTMLVGYTVLSDSRLVGVLALAGALWFLLAPYAEEPWLETHYGEADRRYKASHPRWLL